MLQIRLLGGFHLIANETPVNGIDVPRLQAFLAYLLLHAGTPQTRSHLAFTFWPDSTDSQAYTNLRNIIHKLRQTLPDCDTFLHVDRQTLTWKGYTPDAGYLLDVLLFERAILQAQQAKENMAQQQALSKAIKLYRGDLLPGCYDEWILSERDRLHQMFLTALERLTSLQEQNRDYESAIRTAQQLLRYDSLREPAYCHLMRLYALNGDRPAALRVYHTCSTTLEQELATQPSKTTRELYERLLKTESVVEQEPPEGPTFTATVPLVGRQDEWHQAQASWREAAAGRPHVLLLSGEAGIGKTRLAEELLSWVLRQGFSTATARCYAAEGRLAYAPVTSWLQSDALRTSIASLPDIWLTEIARLLPDVLTEKPGLPHPGPLLESWQRQRFLEALARATIHSRHPLLLFLDDVQWCDSETLEWLHYLLRFNPQAPLLLLCTARAEEMMTSSALDTLLLHLRRDAQVTEVALAPLTGSETAALSSHLAGEQLEQSVMTALYEETEGNPLFVVEAVRAGAVKKVRTMQHAHGDTQQQSRNLLPTTVQAVISARLMQLSPAAREVMSVAATVGRDFTFGVITKASSLDEDALVVGLDELWQRRIIREQDVDAYDFSHDKLREQAYATLSTARRRLLHRRVADALETLYAEDESALNAKSEEIAFHYEQAGAIEQATNYYMRVGATAQRIYANHKALASYKKALSLLEQLSMQGKKQQWREMAAHCHEHIADILALTGDVEATLGAYACVLSLLSQQEHLRQASIYRKIAKVKESQFWYAEAFEAYDAAELALGVEPATPDFAWWQEWIEIQDGKMQIYGSRSQKKEIAAFIEKMRPVIQRYGTPIQRAEFFISSAVSHCMIQGYVATEAVLADARAALTMYEELGDSVKIGWSHCTLGFLLQLRQCLDESEEHVHEAIRYAERTGDTVLYQRALNLFAFIYRKRGQVKKVREYIALMDTNASTPYQRGLCLAQQAWADWREGHTANAEIHGRAALQQLGMLPVVTYTQWLAALPLIAILVSQNRLPDAIEYTHRVLSPEQQRLPEALTTELETALHSWSLDQHEFAKIHLKQAIIEAQKAGYL